MGTCAIVIPCFAFPTIQPISKSEVLLLGGISHFSRESFQTSITTSRQRKTKYPEATFNTMFKYSTTWTVLIPLFMLFIGVLAGPCMPCQTPNRRQTPWDHRLPLRGLLNHSPKITNPTNGTTWITNSDVVVTWDFPEVSNKTSNAKGTLLLGYIEDGRDDEHLNIEHPLASNVNLSKGFMTIKCPKVESRNNYVVVLLGNSGSRSPPFTIQH